jgi:hypothetical protein
MAEERQREVMEESLLESWQKKSRELTQQMRIYEEKYRQKICKRFEENGGCQRNCQIVKGKLYCDHMMKARTKFFKKEINSLIWALIAAHYMSINDREKENTKPSQAIVERPEGIPSPLHIH